MDTSSVKVFLPGITDTTTLMAPSRPVRPGVMEDLRPGPHRLPRRGNPGCNPAAACRVRPRHPGRARPGHHPAALRLGWPAHSTPRAANLAGWGVRWKRPMAQRPQSRSTSSSRSPARLLSVSNASSASPAFARSFAVTASRVTPFASFCAVPRRRARRGRQVRPAGLARLEDLLSAEVGGRPPPSRASARRAHH